MCTLLKCRGTAFGAQTCRAHRPPRGQTASTAPGHRDCRSYPKHRNSHSHNFTSHSSHNDHIYLLQNIVVLNIYRQWPQGDTWRTLMATPSLWGCRTAARSGVARRDQWWSVMLPAIGLIICNFVGNMRPLCQSSPDTPRLPPPGGVTSYQQCIGKSQVM